MANTAAKIESFDDAQYFAKRRVPKFLYQGYEGGSGSGLTLHANAQAFEEVAFHPRAATFFAERDLRTRVLGHELSMPVIISSVGALRLGHRDGEVGVARAAGAAGVIQIVSTATGSPIEDITAAATGPIFYQVYYLGGRDSAKDMIERAKRAGCKAIVLTVDSQAPYHRERPYSDRAHRPTSSALRELLSAVPEAVMHPSWLMDLLLDGSRLQLPMGPTTNGKPMSYFDLPHQIWKQTPAWDDVAWIREQWSGPVVIKGIITVEDARRAVDLGADAIVVSNHGGNCLDGTPAALRVLPEVIAAVGNDVEVLMDSGIRRGADVVKAVALGAKAVLIGRAYVYALVAAGEPGVRRILEIFRRDIDQALSHLGCPAISALDPSYVRLPATWQWATNTHV